MLAAAVCPLAAALTPALANSKLEFAMNSSGEAVPASWRGTGTGANAFPGNYYTKSATVYFTGATAGTVVRLKDDSTSGTVLGTGTANGSGNGGIRLSTKTLDKIKGMGQVLYLQDGSATSDQEGFEYGQSPPSTLPGKQTITIRIDAPGAGKFTITWSGKINGKTYLLANGVKTTTAAGITSVTMSLTPSGKTYLADGKTHAATQHTSFTAKGASTPGAGRTATVYISAGDELG
jgi:hypothetical protein